MFNKFINWKRNIQEIEYFGIIAFFNSELTNLNTVKNEVYKLFNLVPDQRLKNKLLSNDIQFESDDYGSRYFCELESDVREIVKSDFGLSHNIIKKQGVDMISFSFKLDSTDRNLFNELSKINGLTFMIVNNPYYILWENNDRPNSYTYKGGIKTYFCNTFQMEKVDISDRPGRFAKLGNIRFSGGSEYWFGTSFFKLVSKEKILKFKDANKIEECANNVVHIDLMNHSSYWSKESQQRLLNLRNYLGIDDLETKYLTSLK